jgi:5'-3' exonuclease
MPRTILLVDGDQYLHRACAATEHDSKWDDENHVLVSNGVEAFDTVSSSLKKIMDHFNNKDMVLTFSEGHCFRYDIEPTYKGNRAGTRKPLCFFEVREKLRAEYKSVSFNTLEADDVMGILSTKPGPDDKIIVARDKDMNTIPGMLWDGSTFKVITEASADYFHMYQTLVGDAADGYKGCPGIGPKKATQLLDPPVKPEALDEIRVAGVWRVVVEAFVKAGLTEDDALKQARLSRILRWSDWDSVNKQPILWSPPK